MEVNVRLAGAAGQGLQTTADMLGLALTRAGLFAFCHTDAESRIRGGLNFSHLRCAAEPRCGVVGQVDILVAQTKDALATLSPNLAPEGIALTQEDWGHPQAAPFFLARLAKEAGTDKAAGSVALGALAGILGLDNGLVDQVVAEQFKGDDKLTQINLQAASLGRAAAGEWIKDGRFRLPQAKPAGRMWLSGAQALALGAVAGGANFLAGYPMSPATGIMANLAAWGPEAGVYVEQAEDEIAAINMVAGAAFAGARAMTATSGGGFCLMTEGVSLLGMIEAPAVIALAQRPGPATGLPTRLAQGDLNLVRHAGHGFFPRIILAPRNIPDCFRLTAQAFDLAEKYQVPVFILTDQHLQDSQMTLDPPSTEGLPTRRYFLKPEELYTLKDYRRYAWDETGVSAMALPGLSEHVVVVDSDEHDEHGHLTERADLAAQMARKRLAKAETVKQAAWPVEVEGAATGRPLILSWGSTYETVAEAETRLLKQGLDFARLHLRWLWPLYEDELVLPLVRASKLIVVEASVGGEMSEVIRTTTSRLTDVLVNRLDGRPFEVDELAERLGRELRS